MGTTFKNLNQNEDVRTVKTKIHEVIPLTGSIISGTYGTHPNEANIRTYTHGMFQGVYDYPYLSSSANHIFDLSFGTWPAGIYGQEDKISSDPGQKTEKQNIYTQMAQILVGHDVSGNIKAFDHLGDLTSSKGQKMHSAFFMPLSRLLVKDEIQKESFKMVVGTSSIDHPEGVFGDGIKTIRDLNANSAFKNNSPAGEYGILYVGDTVSDDKAVGLIFYQAGVAVLELSGAWGNGSQDLFNQHESGAFAQKKGTEAPTRQFFSSSALTSLNFSQSVGTCSIDQMCGAFRRRIKSVEFRNVTEINSTVYFCRANHNEFNYSTNPTYTTGSKIRVKDVKDDAPVSYVTSVGLYSSDNVMVASAKLSEPLKKSPNTDFTIRVRLDY
tara:strand:- start:1420 stop:2568 length:1149 start_codon:yes stop_codon:yes gene_type:complete